MKTITINIAHEVPEERIVAVRKHLESVGFHNISLGGYGFRIARADHTSCDLAQINGSRGHDLLRLFYAVQDIITDNHG